MSGSTATGAVTPIPPAITRGAGGLGSAQLAALKQAEDADSITGVLAYATLLLNDIAVQHEQGVESLKAIAGPFDGGKSILATRATVAPETIDSFATAVKNSMQEAVQPQFRTIEQALTKTQSELEAERVTAAASQVRLEKLEALAGGFSIQERIADHLRDLVVENRGLCQELVCICHSARLLAGHFCGEKRVEQVEHELTRRHDHETHAAIEQLREGFETRIAEVEAARFVVAERALEQQEHVRELRAGQAEARDMFVRLEGRIVEALEARAARDLVAQMEERLHTRLANLATERQEHFRGIAAATERMLVVAADHERMHARVDRLAGEIAATVETVGERIAAHEARLNVRLSEIAAVSETSLRRSEDVALRLETLHRDQAHVAELIGRMGTEVAAEAEAAAARGTAALRAELSERIAALHQEQRQIRTHLERVEQENSAEARAREISEHLARERSWVEEQMAAHVPGRPQPTRRR